MFEYADNKLYPLQRLDQELNETWAEQRSFKRSEERMAQIGRKIQHLIFELNCRLGEELGNG